MKTLSTLLAATLLLGATAALAADDAKMRGLLRKYAVSLDAVSTIGDSYRKAKTPCLCTGATPSYGYLTSRFDGPTGRFVAACYVPVFNADGSLNTVGTCATYELLGK